MLGCGVVGTGILQLLRDNASTIEGRLGAPIEVTRIAVSDLTKARADVVPTEWVSTDREGLVTADDVDVVVEVMGGLEPAGTLVRAALEAGKHVVTANKALLAEQGDVLLARQAVVAVLYQCDLYIVRTQRGGETQADVPRHIRIALPVDQPRGCGDGNLAAEQELRLPVAEEARALIHI